MGAVNPGIDGRAVAGIEGYSIVGMAGILGIIVVGKADEVSGIDGRAVGRRVNANVNVNVGNGVGIREPDGTGVIEGSAGTLKPNKAVAPVAHAAKMEARIY